MAEQQIYYPKGIAFAPTYACPGGCDHCNLRFDEIDTSITLPLETGIDVLRQAKELGLKGFQIVGGEPTLEEDFFVGLVEEGRKIGMKCHRPPTNCFLGGHEEKLRIFFERLKAAGYNFGFRMSLDRFHEKIPVGHVAKFIAVASEYFNLKKFVVGCCDIDEERSREMLRQLTGILCELGLPAEIDRNRLVTDKGQIKLGFWAPTRPTWKPLPDEEFSFREIDESVSLEEQLRRGGPIGRYGCLGKTGVGYLWIEHDGGVRLCCGNAVNYIDALKMGNVYDDSLEEIVRRAEDSKLVGALAAGGPVEVAHRTGAAGALENKYTHRCELCCMLLTDPEILKKFE
ncbi:radical SAM protein [bacterium]